MSATILNAVQNAGKNIRSLKHTCNCANLSVIAEQLNIALTLLEKGYDASTEIEPLLRLYGSIENVPEYTYN